MLRKMVSFAVLGALLVALVGVPASAQKQEMAPNPLFKGWESFKKGTTVTIEETTSFGDADKAAVPAAGDVKTINYKLLSVDDKKAVVATTVVENEFLSTIESAPTRITYPAQINKADLETALHKADAKFTDGKIMVMGKEVACKIVTGTIKNGSEETTRKLVFAKEVPGGIVERVSTVKRDGKLVAETTARVKQFKAAE